MGGGGVIIGRTDIHKRIRDTTERVQLRNVLESMKIGNLDEYTQLVMQIQTTIEEIRRVQNELTVVDERLDRKHDKIQSLEQNMDTVITNINRLDSNINELDKKIEKYLLACLTIIITFTLGLISSLLLR